MYLPIDKGFDRKFSLYFRNKVTRLHVILELYVSFFIISWFCDKNSMPPKLESLLNLMR